MPRTQGEALQLVRRFVALAIFRIYCLERVNWAKLDIFCHKLETNMLYMPFAQKNIVIGHSLLSNSASKCPFSAMCLCFYELSIPRKIVRW